MKLYRVVVSFEVEAENNEDAIREAMNSVPDGTVESVTEESE